MKYLAFDLGAKTGWAFFDTREGYIRSGVLRVTSKRKGFCRWAAWLEGVKVLLETTLEPLTVSYEQVRRHAGTDAAHAYGAYRALLEMASRQRGVEPIPLGVCQIKKWATGHGHAKKEEMIAAAIKLSGKDITDDNEADAICCAAYTSSGAWQ